MLAHDGLQNHFNFTTKPKYPILRFLDGHGGDKIAGKTAWNIFTDPKVSLCGQKQAGRGLLYLTYEIYTCLEQQG